MKNKFKVCTIYFDLIDGVTEFKWAFSKPEHFPYYPTSCLDIQTDIFYELSNFFGGTEELIKGYTKINSKKEVKQNDNN